MFKNYLIIAWRNLLKNKVYSLINILGLSIGMAVTILIALWIWDEVSYNKNFDHYGQIVRIKENSTASHTVRTFNSVPIPLAMDLRTNYGADFKTVSLASWNLPHILATPEDKFSKEGMFVQPDFAKIFSLNMIAGSANCLNDPYSIVVNQSTATALFGNGDPMNKLVKIDNKDNLKVTGVFKDFPHNSEFSTVTFLVPWEYYSATQRWVKNGTDSWDENSFQIFAQLQEGANVAVVASKVRKELQGHDRSDEPEVVVHPMSKWHLYSEFKEGKNTGGPIQFVWMFGLIGFFVLLLACINFMNLSTARSEKRAREVGVRKAIGSLRKQLVAQFLSESILIAFIAFAVAILLVSLSLPVFNWLADKETHILWSNPIFWTSALLFTLFTGIMAGSYPAFYLSSFQSIKVLKGSFKAGRFASLPRKILVVLQFTVSVALIIGTIIIYQEIQYAKDRPVGYSRGGLLTVNMNTPDLYGHYGALRQDLLNSGAAAEMAESSSPPTDIWSNQSDFNWKGKDPNLNASFGIVRVTHDFGKTVGWRVSLGRDFSRDFPTDTAAMMMNEAAAKFIGMTNPVGETITHEEEKNVYKSFKVIGVVSNIVMESPFDPVKPSFYFLDYENANVVITRINPSLSINAALPKIAAVFKKYNPGAPFDYVFADDEYGKKFSSEQRIGSLATVFAIFAILISCLGLFGLASFTAEQRTKEIGVRKVLGASVFVLWRLLSRDFLVLVGIAILIATPISYYFMSNWLKNYNYRVDISIWIFVATGLMAMLITLLTVSFQSIKAALSNPVKSLRTE